jgi:phosphoglucomutase
MIGDAKVLAFRDYKEGKVVDMVTGAVSETGLPASNVLYFELPDHCWCCARPSGTEPKIKFYMGVTGNSLENAQLKLDQLTEAVKSFV